MFNYLTNSVFYFYILISSENLISDLIKSYSGIGYQQESVIIVDTFFLIFALLLKYSFKKSKQNSDMNIVTIKTD